MNSLHQSILQRSRQVLANLSSVQAVGRLTVAQGMITASLPASLGEFCLLYTSPSPRDRTRSRMPSSA